MAFYQQQGEEVKSLPLQSLETTKDVKVWLQGTNDDDWDNLVWNAYYKEPCDESWNCKEQPDEINTELGDPNSLLDMEHYQSISHVSNIPIWCGCLVQHATSRRVHRPIFARYGS